MINLAIFPNKFCPPTRPSVVLIIVELSFLMTSLWTNNLELFFLLLTNPDLFLGMLPTMPGLIGFPAFSPFPYGPSAAFAYPLAYPARPPFSLGIITIIVIIIIINFF
jgi:hypothetical protein